MKGILRGMIEVPAVGLLLVGLALVALSRKIMDRSPIVAVCAAGAMLFACKHSEKTELLASGHTEAIRLETSQTESVTTRTEGPERITTTVEEFVVDADAPGGTRAGQGQREREEGPSTSRTTRAPPASPILVKRTVTIAERGPVLTESHATALGASQASAVTTSVSKAVHEETSAPAAGCGLGLGLVWLVPLGLLVLAWKFRAILPWWPK